MTSQQDSGGCIGPCSQGHAGAQRGERTCSRSQPTHSRPRSSRVLRPCPPSLWPQNWWTRLVPIIFHLLRSEATLTGNRGSRPHPGHRGLTAALDSCLLPSAILLSSEESLLLAVSKQRLGICQLGLDRGGGGPAVSHPREGAVWTPARTISTNWFCLWPARPAPASPWSQRPGLGVPGWGAAGRAQAGTGEHRRGSEAGVGSREALGVQVALGRPPIQQHLASWQLSTGPSSTRSLC